MYWLAQDTSFFTISAFPLLKMVECREIHGLISDINECTENIAKCGPNMECSNIPGGYECVEAKKDSVK